LQNSREKKITQRDGGESEASEEVLTLDRARQFEVSRSFRKNLISKSVKKKRGRKERVTGERGGLGLSGGAETQI